MITTSGLKSFLLFVAAAFLTLKLLLGLGAKRHPSLIMLHSRQLGIVIETVTLSQDGWQLFFNHVEQVPARWPNAQFSDDTVFNRSYWAEGTLNNSNNAYTIGWLTDAGPEAGVHTGLNETINATGLDLHGVKHLPATFSPTKLADI